MKRTCAWMMAGVLLLGVAAEAAMWAAPVARGSRGGGMPFVGELSLGVVNGEAKEHVYDYEGFRGARRRLSRLDWELKNVAMGGGSLSVRPFVAQQNLLNRLSVNGGMWIALTEGSGEMEDYDWMSTSSADWTHYSLSKVDVKEGYIFDFNVGVDLWAEQSFALKALAGYKQNGWLWKDRGVYLLYPENGYIPQYLNGEHGIKYEQEFRMPYLGATVSWAQRDWAVEGYLAWSPLVSATDWDDHVARGLHFKESFKKGDMMGFGVELRYELTRMGLRNWFATAAVDYQKIDHILGDLSVVVLETGERDSEDDIAGIENNWLTVSLGAGLRF